MSLMKICVYIYELEMILVSAIVNIHTFSPALLPYFCMLSEISCRLTIALAEMDCYRKLQWMGKATITDLLGFRTSRLACSYVPTKGEDEP